MPRGVKGSGKSRKPTGEPGQPRRRGRKPKDRIPEVVQPAESPPAEPLTIEPPLAEAPPADAPSTGEPDPETSTPVPAPEQLPEVLPYTPTPSPVEQPAPLPPPPVAGQSNDLAEAEQEFVAKYPNVNIEVGSLRAGAAEGWGGKRIVTIRCAACSRPRTVATSDLFHVRYCEDCTKVAKKAARSEKRAEQ